MKKIHKLSAVLLALASFAFTGCFDPIFYEIRQDVAPETATVSGNINSIARVKIGSDEYLMLGADGGLRIKSAGNQSHGAWSTVSTPFSVLSYDFDSNSFPGEQIIKVVSDAKYAYVLTALFATSASSGTSYPSSFRIWAYDLSTKDWGTNTKSIGYTSSGATNFTFFGTNSPNPLHRHAYLGINSSSSGWEYFELNGTGTSDPGISSIEDTTADVDATKICSAVWTSSGVKFFSSIAATTNETATTAPTYVYYGSSSTLKYKSLTESDEGSLDVGAYIASLATCSNSIIIGCGNPDGTSTAGIKRATLDTHGKPIGMAGFSTNAQFQITSDYTVLALLNATPDQPELNSALYASITFPNSSNGIHDNIGLWSYYPSRGNWNRE